MGKIMCMVLAGILGVFPVSAFAAKESVIVTTMDLDTPYEVIRIVAYRISVTDVSKLIAGIKNEGVKAGADAIVGLRLTYYTDYFYAYGTAVKFKKGE